MFTSLFPIVTTSDIDAALGFYRDLLGAKVTFEFPGPDGRPGYVGLDLGASHVGIGHDPNFTAGPSARVLDPDGNLVHVGQAAAG